VTFLTVLQVDEGAENPLPALAAYRVFQEELRPCVAAPPVADRLTIVGSYRFFE